MLVLNDLVASQKVSALPVCVTALHPYCSAIHGQQMFPTLRPVYELSFLIQLRSG